jgi:hypothetical protein
MHIGGIMPNELAEPICGREIVLVCLACGKMSKDKYGYQPMSAGWDVSCMMNSRKFYLDKLVVVKEKLKHIGYGALVV